MKRILFRSALICSALSLMAACSKGGNDSGAANLDKVTIGGENYVIDGGSIIYWGDYYGSENTEDISLYLYDKEEIGEIYLDLLVATGDKTLIPGKYTFGTELKPFTILATDSEAKGKDGVVDVTGGSITVAESNGVFTITFDLDTESGKLTGKCTKSLERKDATLKKGLLTGTISVGDTDVAIETASAQYYGLYEVGFGANIDLFVTNKDLNSGVYVEMLAPEGKPELAAGEYQFKDSYKPFTFTSSSFAMINNKNHGITGGTVTVDKLGNIYSMTLNLTSNAGNVTGTISGRMVLENQSM